MKMHNNKGAALYLVVVATSIAVTLLMIMYGKLSAVAINAIEAIDATQEEFYLESALDMYRSGKGLEEIEDLFQELGWEMLDGLEEYLYQNITPELEEEDPEEGEPEEGDPEEEDPEEGDSEEGDPEEEDPEEGGPEEEDPEEEELEEEESKDKDMENE